MCGIAAISIGRACRNRIPYPTLRRLCGDLLAELQPRGFDASGIAVINDFADGAPQSVAFKKPLRPTRLVVRPRFKETLESIGPHTNFVMLHARASTVGNTKDNYNNHPIITRPIIGIHNGTLHNHEELFAEFAKEFDQEGDVDSEIIFRLYGHFLKMGLTPVDAIKKTSEKLLGAFTGAAVSLTHPHQMVMFKFERPLAIIRIPYYDMIIATSEVRYYDAVKYKLGIKAKDTVTYPREGVGFFTDLNLPGRIADREKENAFKLPIDLETNNRLNQAQWLQYAYA